MLFRSNSTVVGADATAISHLNAGLVDRYKTSIYNDKTIAESDANRKPGWSVLKNNNAQYGAYGTPDPATNSPGFQQFKAELAQAEVQVATLDTMWDEYKKFLKTLSTNGEQNDETPSRSVTKELIDENRNKLKDLLQYNQSTYTNDSINIVRQRLLDEKQAAANAAVAQANAQATQERIEDAFSPKIGRAHV